MSAHTYMPFFIRIHLLLTLKNIEKSAYGKKSKLNLSLLHCKLMLSIFFHDPFSITHRWIFNNKVLKRARFIFSLVSTAKIILSFTINTLSFINIWQSHMWTHTSMKYIVRLTKVLLLHSFIYFRELKHHLVLCKNCYAKKFLKLIITLSDAKNKNQTTASDMVLIVLILSLVWCSHVYDVQVMYIWFRWADCLETFLGLLVYLQLSPKIEINWKNTLESWNCRFFQ